MDRTVKAAAVNFKPWSWHVEWNCDRLEEYVRCAASRGAELVVAPENCIDGAVTNACIYRPELRERAPTVAVTMDSGPVRRFRDLARELGICLVIGCAELVDGRDMYNTGVFIGYGGEPCGTYHKVQFAEGYDDTWSFNRLGRQIRAFDTPLGRCGMMICNDRWNPDIARTLVLDGARFLCVLTYGCKDREQDRHVLARARENGVPIVQSNVGGNLIISNGEIVGQHRKLNAVTLASIVIPQPPDPAYARELERKFMEERPAEMAVRLQKTRDRATEFNARYPRCDAPPKPRNMPIAVRDFTA